MNDILAVRRAKLMENKQGPCMICVFAGRGASGDRNFYYLTGIDRANMILLLRKTWTGEVTESLYIEPYDELQAKWVGGRMRAAEATEISGIRDIRDVGSFETDVASAISGSRGLGKMQVWMDLAQKANSPALELAAMLQKNHPAVGIEDFYGDIAALRAVKSEDEIALMRKAQETTRVAIEAMMKHSYAGINECELEGAFDFALMKQGIREHAFPSIVAGGPRATILHYGNNNTVVEDGQMVLIDLGSAEAHYCADISRTFPVNGKFTERQKEIYNTVLEAQRMVIAAAKPGLTLRDLNQMVIDYYETRLDDLGLRKDGKTVRDYYYHSVSHQLGLDCHDACTERERLLKPGMVITVEPGMYIEDEGIGVRIENDVLITEDGCIDLSVDILRTVEDIEALMAK